MEIKQILDEIVAENGDNMKMQILRKYVDNETLERVLYMSSSKRMKYYVKKIPEYTSTTQPTRTLSEAIDLLGVFSERKKTGNDAVQYLTEILSSLSANDANVFERIIKKDIKIGMGTTNINKVFGDLIEKTPYMGAKSFSKKLAAKFFAKGQSAKSDVKMDGRYANAIIKGGEVELESRSGETTFLQGAKFMKELAQFDAGYVLNGELTMKHDSIQRYEANGIIASLVDIGKKRANGLDVSDKLAAFEAKHMPYTEALDSIVYTCWDVITFDEYFSKSSKTPYSERWENLLDIIDKTTMVQLVEYKIVSSYDEAMGHFLEMLERGEEGTILKTLDGPWKNGKPTTQMKMKLEMTVDLIITGFQFGKEGTKNEHKLSRILCESSDGLVKSRTSNMKESEIDYVTDNSEDLVGTIIEVQSCGLSQNREGQYALLHPSFKSFRGDKDTCDDLQSIKEIERMAKELKID